LRFFKCQIICKPGFGSSCDVLVIYLVCGLLHRSSGFCDKPSAGNLGEDISPCSRQGLPPPHVTVHGCGLLPHSFHPYPHTTAPNLCQRASSLHQIVDLLLRQNLARLSQCINIHFLRTSQVFPCTRLLQRREGGFVSVALSLRLPSVAVSNCPSLRCPDFPPPE
jgi:hypothetical protein